MTKEKVEQFKEICDKVLEELEKMTPEEFKRDFLCLNGVMTEELFDKVMNQVIKEKSIDGGNDCWDYPSGVNEKSKIHPQEFADVIYYLREFFDKDKYIPIEGMFYNAKVFFTWKENHFIYEILVGQGEVNYLSIDTKDEWKQYLDKTVNVKIDPTVNFYKRIKE